MILLSICVKVAGRHERFMETKNSAYNIGLVGVGHCFAWQGYSSLLEIDNEIITGVRGLVI
jgi:hypothetical protein